MFPDSLSVTLPVTLTETVTLLGNSVSTCSLNSAPAAAVFISESKDDGLLAERNSESEIVGQLSSECLSASDVLYTPKDLEKGTFLKPLYYVLDNGLVFHDKLLPDPSQKLAPDFLQYDQKYYVNLHYRVSLFPRITI